MNKKIPLTAEQEKRMKDVLKLRILNEFNRQLEQKIALLKNKKQSHA